MWTREQRQAFIAGKVCEICEATPAEVVDHSHVTRKIRGPLCNRHNVGLGWFGDDPALLRAAADYLDRHADAPPLESSV